MVNFNAVSQYAGRLFKALTVLGISATLVLTTESVSAQSVGVSDNTITPNTHSLMDIRWQGGTPGKGLLIPRLSYAQRIALTTSQLNDDNTASTDRGMLVYQYNDNNIPFVPRGLFQWNGSAWVRILDDGSASGWLLGGNSPSGTDFLGTNNTQPLRIHTNGGLRYTISTTGRLLAHQDGTAVLPLISWNGDDNTGIYRIGDDILGFSTAGEQRLRIAADGNVGIGVTPVDAVLEKLQVTGNVLLSRGGNRTIALQNGLAANQSGNNLEIRAGSGFPHPTEGAAGGDLILKAGSANAALSQHRGDVRIVSGGNTFDGPGSDGDVIFETGALAPSVTNSERMRIFNNGLIRINSLGGSGDRLVQTNNAGEISIGPALSSFGTVTSITAGAGLSGGTITSSGTIAIANDGVTSAMILNGTVANADLANMNGYTVKVRNDAAAGVPSDFAVGTESVLGRNGAGFVSISAGTNGHVLRRTGGSIGFSQMPITDLGGTANRVFYTNNAGVMTELALGAAGTVLQSTGATTAPTFVTPSSLNANLTAANGLQENTASAYNGSTARNFKLGGALTENTSITQGSFTFAVSGNTINLNDAAGTAVTNIGTGTTTGAVNIGTGAAAKTVNLGSINTTSATTINSGSGAVNVNTVASSGNVLIGNATNNVGIGGAVNATYKVNITGRVKSTGINETSDERLKVNFASIEGALDKVLAMNGKYYDWRTLEFPNMGLSEGRQVGVIAQEMEKILPEVVTTGDDGFKAVEYGHIVPVLIEAIKEQQAIIAVQQQEITSLQSMKDELNTLKASIELLNEHLKTSQK
jgi:hypothetical protein